MADLAEDSVQLVVRLLKEAQLPEIKTVYDGDPDKIPNFNLPCLVVEQLTDVTEAGSFSEDDVTDTLQVRVIYDRKDDWAVEMNPENTTHTKIRKLIGARDAATGDYLPNTIKGVLRPQLYGARRIATNMTVDYGAALRANESNETFASTEGHVTIGVQYIVDVDFQPSE